MSVQEIAINGWSLVKADGLKGHWMTGKEIGQHLGYAEAGKAVRKIYERHQDNFKIGIDVGSVNLTLPGGAQETRVFSERGTLKVVRYSNTAVADAVMDEVFDVYLAVREQAKKSTIVHSLDSLPKPQASDVLADWMKAAAILEVPKYYAQSEAVKAVKRCTDVDYTPLLLKAPVQDNVPEAELYLEPTELGKKLGISARKTNKFLEIQGLQIRVNKVWQVTDKGKEYSQVHYWTVGSKSGFNFKWQLAYVAKLWDERGG